MADSGTQDPADEHVAEGSETHDKTEIGHPQPEVATPAVIEPVAAADRETATVQPPADEPRRGFWRKLRDILSPENIFPRFVRNKLGRSARICALSVIVLLFGGSACGAWYYTAVHRKPATLPKTVFAARVTPFSVVSTSPADSAQNVDVNEKITIVFNRAVDPMTAKNEFFISPTIEGVFSQGINKEQVVFTPSAALQQGTIVKVMVHGELQSKDGSALGKDYTFGYETAIPSDGVVFALDGAGTVTKLDSAKSNQVQHFALQVGKNVNPNGQITIYKGTTQTLLQSLVYHDVPYAVGGGTYPDFLNTGIGTDSLAAVSTTKGLSDGQKLDVEEDTGLYLVMATSDGKQVGWTWVVFNNAGLLVKQDPRQVVVAVQNLDNTPVSTAATVTLYNLKGSVTSLQSNSVTSMQDFQTIDSNAVDIVVATIGQDTMIAPLGVPESLADIRGNNPTNNNYFYGLTDKPVYGPQDVIKFAAFTRQDNDAQFLPPRSNAEQLFVAQTEYDTHLANFSVAVSSSGVISGSIPVNASFLPSDQQNQQLTLYGYADTTNTTPIPITTFTVTKAVKPSYGFRVSFAKKEYLANEAVSATVRGTNADGSPMANASITYNIYAKTYYENNQSANLASIGTNGQQIGIKDATLNFDGAGHGTIPIDLTKLPDDGSQVVTVVVSKQDASNVYSSGGSSAIIHMGNAVITFGTGRTTFHKNENIDSNVYVTRLDGSPLANSKLTYQFVQTTYDNATQKSVDHVIATGNAQTDGNGYAEVNQGVNTGDISYVTLVVAATDENNLTVKANTSYDISSPTIPIAKSDLTLSNLNIRGSNGKTAVGDTLHLTITAPADMVVLAAQQRGLLYTYSMLQLKQGSNDYSIGITQQLAPSFTLSFSYFQNGQYYSEGTSFDVSTLQKQATLKLTADKQQYTAGDKASLTLQITAPGNASVQSDVVLGVVDANIFSLNDMVAPDIFTSFYQHREITTNATSSLTGIGSGGGGKCGGSGDDGVLLANNIGATILWNPSLQTNGNGTATVSFTVPKGLWRVYAYSADSDSIVGSTDLVMSAQ